MNGIIDGSLKGNKMTKIVTNAQIVSIYKAGEGQYIRDRKGMKKADKVAEEQKAASRQLTYYSY